MSVKGPGNNFDLNPKWGKPFLFENISWDVYIAHPFPQKKTI
jgi:hypothetical protein